MALQFRKTKLLSPTLTNTINQVLRELRSSANLYYNSATERTLNFLLEEVSRCRGASDEVIKNSCERMYKKLEHYPEETLLELSHFFTIALELVNTCESAYRTSRLAIKKSATFKDEGSSIEFVLTAHPTESRRPDIVFILKKLQADLENQLLGKGDISQTDLQYLLRILLKTSLAKQSRPTVSDEIDYLFLSVLQKRNLEIFTSENFYKCFSIGSWVGGDKDGHPGVNEETVLCSFQRSRTILLEFLTQKLRSLVDDLAIFHGSSGEMKREISEGNRFLKLFEAISKVREGDGAKLLKIKHELPKWCSSLSKKIKITPPQISKIMKLLDLFPALVIPVEYREAAVEINDAATSKKRSQQTAIGKMLHLLQKVSNGGDPYWYVQSFIISQVRGKRDIRCAHELLNFYKLSRCIPLVPLLEMAEAFGNLPEILDEVVRANPKTQVEIMLGYSDSAKEMGVLPARVHISRTMSQSIAYSKKLGRKFTFFHGSGGSVSRGGGSTEEQLSWFPKEARSQYKATIQGEMVERTFASPEILLSKLNRIFETLELVAKKKSLKPFEEVEVLEFAKFIEEKFRKTVVEPSFLNVLKKSTPYAYLSDLRIGSRPSKRKNLSSLGDLRAIPWVMSWTQTRLMLSVWWGVGSAWEKLPPEHKKVLKRLAKIDPLISSFSKQLGFTLAKVEFGVWQFIFEKSDLSVKDKEIMGEEIKRELFLTRKALREISSEKDPLWYRPWLQESIYFRSPIIHPLNVMAKIAQEKGHTDVLREATTGIACGMLTTG